MNFKGINHVDTKQSKLILLYVFDKIEISLTENSIFEICWSKNDWLDYMDIVDVLPQLVDMNFVTKIKDADNEARYKITDYGRECLKHFYTNIPASTRDDILNFCKNNRMEFKRAQEYVASFVKSSGDSYVATLKIKDLTELTPILDIKIKYSSRNEASNACKYWRINAPIVYESIIENLQDNNLN